MSGHQSRIGVRPKGGRYVSSSGQPCHVLVRREATEVEDGSVAIWFDDGSYTVAFFRTFERWDYRRVEDDSPALPLERRES